MWSVTTAGAWRSDEGVELSGWSGELRLRGTRRGFKAKATEDLKEIGRREGRVSFEITLRPKELPDGTRCLEIDGEVSNHADEPLGLERLKLRSEAVRLPGDHYIHGRRFFKNGYQSWSESRSFGGRDTEMRSWLPTMVELQDNIRNLPPHRGARRRGKFRSDFFALLGAGSSRRATYLLCGQAESFNQFVYVRSRLNRLRRPPYLEIIYDFGDQWIPEHATVRLDPVLLIAGSEAEGMQHGFLREVARRARELKPRWSLAGRERPQLGDRKRLLAPRPRPGVSAWCSWYYYYTRVTMESLERNLRLARRNGARWDYFILDDGYQAALGDWLRTNEKFPDDLGVVARRIREYGFAPGIWIAPFVAGRGSRIYENHRDWFIRHRGPVRASWNPHWGKDSLYYALDLTHPEVQQYVRKVVETLTKTHGFSYLKLDFLYAAALPGRCYDMHYSSAERLKLGYDLIREAAGPEVFLLGCGTPLGQAIGRVEAMRVGPDVAPFWFDTVRYYLTQDPHAASTLFAIRSVLNRAPMHGKFWANDPDCMMLRDRDILMNRDEQMSLANTVAVTGGSVTVSDRLDLLSEESWRTMVRLEDIGRLCAAGEMTPVGFMHRRVPEILVNDAGYLLVLNVDEEPKVKRIEVGGPLERVLGSRNGGGKTLRDVWTGERFPPKEGSYDLGTLPRHGSKLLSFRDED